MGFSTLGNVPALSYASVTTLDLTLEGEDTKGSLERKNYTT